MNYEDHDDLCPMKHEQWPKHPLEKCWQCDLIALVRDDMLAKCEFAIAEARHQEAQVHSATERWSPLSHLQGQRDALADAVQRVEALANEMRNWSSAETTAATEAVPDLTFDQWLWVQRGVLRSIAAIKGDQP